ncbi:MAG TPA: alpha-glucan family phosphorylase [Anaerolineaceae bacterium]
MEQIISDYPNSFSLPRRIGGLGPLAYNLWWVWTPEAQRLYMRIDPTTWEQSHHNPVTFLDKVARPRLNAATNDRYFLESYDRVMRAFDSYIHASDTYYNTTYPGLKNKQIAYLSFEFGLHESLPVYAGGLGILAGDHLKEASDLGLPLVGLGFYYAQGYFSQRITEDGWQETRDMNLNFERMPIVPLSYSNGKPVMISIDLAGRKVHARLWQVIVGRVKLILLDTNVEPNQPSDRMLASRLYTNDPEIRISQEILLGRGGVRALRALGYNPSIWHMNEGHSAFLTIECLLEKLKEGLTIEEAQAEVRRATIFTTHTSVPAGIDQFPVWLIDKYFNQVWSELSMTREQFLDLGRQQTTWGESFSMANLAFKLSDHANGVSELHGQVSRHLFAPLWSGRREEDVPISHITNGVHTATWIARRMRILLERYLGKDWIQHVDDLGMWSQIDNIPDEEIWAIRQHLKRKLVNFAKERARQRWLTATVHPVQVIAEGVLLDPYALTIGFARRFATYKRGYLVLRDYDRLLRIVNKPNMPVQFVFAGKAHPADEPGKLIIQQVYRAVKDARFGGRLIFLEDYDMNVARNIVQGVDVWLNTPRRPHEASGTSGMKAVLSGVLNFSVLDGWWREGYNGQNGWAIGEDADYTDNNLHDEVDAESLYDTLENDIVPMYYTSRSADGMPNDWVARIKESMRTLIPLFSTRRMLKEYLTMMYLPAMGLEQEELVEGK